MRRKTIGPAGIAALAIMLFGCDPGNFDLLLKAVSHQANTLKILCQQNNYKAPEISRADSLVTVAGIQQTNGQKEQAFTALDRAVIYYRLALSKQETQKTQKTVEAARTRLADDEEQLSTYRAVLAELKGEKK